MKNIKLSFSFISVKYDKPKNIAENNKRKNNFPISEIKFQDVVAKRIPDINIIPAPSFNKVSIFFTSGSISFFFFITGGGAFT